MKRLALIVAAALPFAAAAAPASPAAVPERPSVSTASALSVSISGRNHIQPYDDCTWYAGVSGGTAPYTYTWSMSGGSGTSSGNAFTGAANGTGSFRVDVYVVDAVGRTGSAVINGQVSWNTYACFTL